MISKSFIDLLFILLCATIVMLGESVRLGAVQADPVQAPRGDLDRVDWNAARVVAVDEANLALDDHHFTDVTQLIAHLTSNTPPPPILLVPANDRVTHHRVMNVWTRLRNANLNAQLGGQATTQPSTQTHK